MLECFSSSFSGFSGRFGKSCLEQLFCTNLLVYASVKKNSTADVISGILRNFGNTQGKGVKFVGLKFIKEELYYRAQPRNFPKFSKHLG